MKSIKKKFLGADDIYLTQNSIAVRRISSYQDRNGKYHLVDKTKYYKKNQKNLKTASSIYGHIRYGR